MSKTDLNRRAFLGKAGLLGCSLAASPLMTPISLASAPWDHRLVVIILRGAMDGLDVVRPLGDADYAMLRPTLVRDNAGQHDLDGFYALHPALAPLMPLWQAGELGFVHDASRTDRRPATATLGEWLAICPTCHRSRGDRKHRACDANRARPTHTSSS